MLEGRVGKGRSWKKGWEGGRGREGEWEGELEEAGSGNYLTSVSFSPQVLPYPVQPPQSTKHNLSSTTSTRYLHKQLASNLRECECLTDRQTDIHTDRQTDRQI